MRFPLPLLPAEFEIPDEWWAEAGMSRFTPAATAYRSKAGATHIPLRDIEPPVRQPDVTRDFRGFDRSRMISVLAGIAANEEIAPVPVLILPRLPDISHAPFRFRALDGLHRYYASVAAGFEHLPSAPRECFG